MSLSCKRLINVIVCVCIIAPWLLSEVRWARINNPNGKFSSVDGYLAAGRLPSRVMKFDTNESIFYIAYSPMDTLLAIPSGPAAYVFDESGEMVTWSGDNGDDPTFQEKYPFRKLEKSSLEDLRRIGKTRP